MLLALPRWNWGAFLLSWGWALGHRMYVIALVLFLTGPMVASLALGAMGNELAWRYRPFSDVEEFQKVQAAWTKWGIAAAVVVALLVIVAIFVFATELKSFLSDMRQMPKSLLTED